MLLGLSHARTGHCALALRYARASLDYFSTHGCPDWEIAMAHATMARAGHAACRPDLHEAHYREASFLGSLIANPDERELFLKVFCVIAAPGCALLREAPVRILLSAWPVALMACAPAAAPAAADTVRKVVNPAGSITPRDQPAAASARRVAATPRRRATSGSPVRLAAVRDLQTVIEPAQAGSRRRTLIGPGSPSQDRAA